MRDTDADWCGLAESEPYFSVLTEEQYRASNLKRETVERFYESGRDLISWISEQLERLYGQHKPKRALDFGCGVGRLTIPMAAKAHHVTGVDVSPEMLRLAGQRAHTDGIDNVAFVSEIPVEAFDWINSFIVFQHIPPTRGIAILRTLLDRLSPNGFASIHITLYRHARHVSQITRDQSLVAYDGSQLRAIRDRIEVNKVMSMFDYDATQLLSIFFEAGFSSATLNKTDHDGYIGAYFFGRKGH
jgi:SAM-dependent methyltransferase